MDFERLIGQFGLSIDQTQSINPVVLSISVQVDHQDSRRLDVKRYDDPFIISSKFCKEHSLSPHQRDLIEREITDHLNQEIERENIKTPKQTQEVLAHLQTSRKAVLKTPATKQRTGPATISSNKSNMKSSLARSRTPAKSRLSRNISSNNMKRQQQMAAREEKQNEKEMSQCTFKPMINMVSSILAQHRESRMAVTDRSKLIAEKQRQLEQEMKECTFKPKLNQKSKIMGVRDKSTLQSIFSHLYRKGVEKQRHREKSSFVDEQCTFRPQINSFSFPEHKQCKFKYTVDEQNCSFNPKINQINVPYNPNKVDKWTFLQRKEEHERCQPDKIQQVDFNSREQRVYAEFVDKIARIFFAMLDDNNDGWINADNMDFTQIPAPVLKLSKHFLQQIEDLQLQVDQELFVTAFRQFFSRLDLTGREAFLKLSKKSDKNKEESKNQVALLSNQERDRILVKKYEEGMRRQKAKLQAQAKADSRRRVQQLRECTFKPIISDSVWYEDSTYQKES